VDHGIPQPDVAFEAPREKPLIAPIAGPEIVAPGTGALQAALDRAFAEPAAPPHRYTKAVVVVHDGKIVAERYAPGIGVDTPLIGWSMTKSVTNALIGIQVKQHKISVEGPAPIAEWSDPRDPDMESRSTTCCGCRADWVSVSRCSTAGPICSIRRPG
jgi:CubicO group peptidase (beta-lactamase class C family)